MWGLTGALLVAAVLLVVAFTDGPQPEGAFAGGTPVCDSAATDGDATIYPSPVWGEAGTAGVVELYGAPGFEGERVVEVIWGGATPDQGTLIGVGTIPIFGTDSTDITFTVPNDPPGTYTVWVCWDNGGGDTYSYEWFEFTILAPEGPAGDPSCLDFEDNDADGLTDFEDPGCQEPGASAVELAEATAIACGLVGAEYVALPPLGSPNGVYDSPLGQFPTSGSSFAIFSSGAYFIADYPNSAEDSGTDDGGGNVRGNTDYDVSIVRIDCSPPAGSNCLMLDFAFYSEEYPEYVGTEYNDSFIAELNTSSWTTDGSSISAPDNFAFDEGGEPISINSTGATSMSEANAAGTTYDGATALLSARKLFEPGDLNGDLPGTLSVFLSIFDQGDAIYDSAAFVDSIRTGIVNAGQCTSGATPVEICGDGIDNDGDDLVDANDPDCATTSPTLSPTPTPSPTASPTPIPTTTPDCRRFAIAGTVITPDPCETRPPETPSPTVQSATETPVPTDAPTDAPTAPPTAPPDVGTPAPPGDTPAPTPTASPTLIPPETQTPFVTESPTTVVTPTATPTAAQATATPAVTPTATATPGASATASPTSISVAATPRPTIIGNANATATATVAPTRTPTATPVRTPSPSPTVLSEQDPPDGSTDDPGSVVTDDPGSNHRPEVIRSVFTPADISGDIGIIGTNVVLAGFTLMLMLLTAEIFNQTVEDNEQWLKDGLARTMGPLRGVLGVFADAGRALTDGRGIAGIVAPVFLLALAAFLYGLEEPGAGFNDRTLVLFLSFLGAFGILTYLYDGGQLLVTNRYRVPAAIRLFPAGIIVALFCIGMTKLLGFQPGIIYGFIAAHTLMGAHSLSDEQEGKQIFFPAVALLTVCAAAWLLVDPARNLAEDNNSFWAAVPEGVAVGIFVGGLEGMFFQMIPIKWMDGEKLMKWSKLAWFSVTGVTAFLFWHVLLNTERESFGTLSETTPAIALLLMGICFATTVGFYLFCRIRNARAPLGA